MSKPYRYRVVAANGSVVHGDEYKTLTAAVNAARQLYVKTKWIDIEVERFLQGKHGVRTYWMRAGLRWELFDPKRDIVERNPNYGTDLPRGIRA